jgi:RNA polymerase sigma-70 factor (ECF subfamily)
MAGHESEQGLPSDGDIISESLQSPACFTEIFDRYVSHISRFLLRRAGQDAAEDLVAETFIVAFRVRENFDLTAKSARPWLYGIATNVLRHHFRAEGRARQAQEHLQARMAVDHLGDEWTSEADERTEFLRLQPLLEAALDELDPDWRDALLLFAYAGMTYAEISQALAIPIGTVRSRIARSRPRLRELLGRSMATKEGSHSPRSREQDRHG